MSQEALQRLLDESEIKNLLTRLSYSIDERDVPKCRGVFVDEMSCDFDALGGAPVKATLSADVLSTKMLRRTSEFQSCARGAMSISSIAQVEADLRASAFRQYTQAIR